MEPGQHCHQPATLVGLTRVVLVEHGTERRHIASTFLPLLADMVGPHQAHPRMVERIILHCLNTETAQSLGQGRDRDWRIGDGDTPHGAHEGGGHVIQVTDGRGEHGEELRRGREAVTKAGDDGQIAKPQLHGPQQRLEGALHPVPDHHPSRCARDCRGIVPVAREIRPLPRAYGVQQFRRPPLGVDLVGLRGPCGRVLEPRQRVILIRHSS